MGVAVTLLLLSLVTSAAAGKTSASRVLDVRYTGGSHVAADSVLHANAAARGARVVAVTFFLDGRPVGSDTTKPYALDLTGDVAKPGAHRVRVVAVDSLGRRAASSTRTLTVTRARHAMVTASPTAGLKHALHELARGGHVRLLPGVYRLAQVRLGSGARLIGSGPKTVISPPDGPYWSLLINSGRNIRIADLTLDGAGAGGGHGYGVEVQSGSSDIRVQRVTMRHVRGVGLHAWGAYSEVSIQDSSISGDGNGSAGVVAGESGSLGKSRDTSVIRCRISGFRDYGVTFAYRAHGVPDAALHAVAIDNVISDINNPSTANGTNEGAIWSGGVEAAIIGNRIARTGWDGIETVGTSTNVSVIRNRITDTMTGIYIEHATTGSLIANNHLGRVDTGINVEWTYGGIGSVENKFVGNNIYSVGKYGIFLDVGSDRNHVLSNQFLVGDKPAIILQGASKNLIRGNRLCAVKNQLVKEQVGRWDSGALAYPSENTIVGNRVGVTCRRGPSG